MTGAETALAAGAVGFGVYALSNQGGLPNGLSGVVPAGSTVTVNISGVGPWLTLSTDSTPFSSQFESAIQTAGAGYQVTNWSVKETVLTSALLNNQVPYAGTITVVTTVDFGQGQDLVNSIAGYVTQVTGYTPTVNANGALGQGTGAVSTSLDLSGLGTMLTNLATGSSTLLLVAIVGVFAIIWTNQREVVRRVA